MPIKQPNLTDFLLARIAEDEEVARDVFRIDTWHLDRGNWQDPRADLVGGGKILAEFDDDHGQMAAHHVVRWNPERVLAECEAKRRIVEELAIPYIAERRRLMNGQPSWGDEHPELLRWLALPYADHPDYREEWQAQA